MKGDGMPKPVASPEVMEKQKAIEERLAWFRKKTAEVQRAQTDGTLGQSVRIVNASPGLEENRPVKKPVVQFTEVGPGIVDKEDDLVPDGKGGMIMRKYL
jgi:hypothetical protein